MPDIYCDECGKSLSVLGTGDSGSLYVERCDCRDSALEECAYDVGYDSGYEYGKNELDEEIRQIAYKDGYDEGLEEQTICLMEVIDHD